MTSSISSSSARSPNRENGITPTEESSRLNSRGQRSPNSDTPDKVDTEKPKDGEKKKSKIAQLWEKLDLDLPTALMMMKAAVPPALALAMYQADSVAREYSTLGYLLAIVSILGFAIMPRAKFIQTMTLNLISTCIGAAVSLLMIWCGVKAREHTTPQGSRPVAYNSSQSAVCAIWLFFQIYFINSVKAKFPQFAFPTILYSIFAMVGATYGPQFLTMAQGEAFARRLLETFLTGFAIATGVSLFIMPITCRKIVWKEITVYIGLLRGALQAHKAYLQSLETTDMFGRVCTIGPKASKEEKKKKTPSERPEVAALKAVVGSLTALHGKLHSDLPFAKREVAFGKLGPDDLSEITKLLRGVMTPTVGLSSLVDIFGRFAELSKWNAEDPDPETEALREKAVSEWNEVMGVVHEPFARLITVMDQGLEHVLLRLELTKAPKKKKGSDTEDVEAKGDSIRAGDAGFADYLDQQSKEFYQGKELALRTWCERKGIKLSSDFFEHPATAEYTEPSSIVNGTLRAHQRNQRQLYLLLFIEYLLYSISQAILKFVRFADKAVEDGKLSKYRLLVPGKRRIRKWVANIFQGDAPTDDTTTVADVDTNNSVVYMGEAYKSRKDPEHLPPQNIWEKIGDFIRIFPRFLRSPESAFGFRSACATMSIAIIAYLHQTQAFFVKQRLVWAMIMVAISMSPAAGQTVFSLVLRLGGTVVAMVAAFCVWYIPDEHTAGVIVFLWVFVSLAFYIPLKKPQFIIVGLISIVTTTLIVGYELEVKKVGKTIASSNGQPYYPIYLLGPYRLATVAAGLGVAFIWTFFPFPISEHSALRQSLGGAMYLSANYYSIVHETVGARMRGDEGDAALQDGIGKKLAKARIKVFGKQMLILEGLRARVAFLDWEIPLGGKFPRQEYEIIIQSLRNIVNYMTLVEYASQTFTDPELNEDGSEAEWIINFRRLIRDANVTTHEITSLLALLSSSITNGQPLPPYLAAPQPYQISAKLEQIDRDILSIRHLAEPGYAAFAVIQISTRCIVGDMEKLLKSVKNLVGELDFSFHVVSTQSSSSNSSNESLFKPVSGRNKQD